MTLDRCVHTMPFGAELREDGVAFRLWAPSRARATAIVDGEEHALEPRSEGWFERTVSGARAGARYSFAFPDRDVRVPDPAAVEGVDARHRAFQMTATELTTRINFLLVLIRRQRAGQLPRSG